MPGITCHTNKLPPCPKEDPNPIDTLSDGFDIPGLTCESEPLDVHEDVQKVSLPKIISNAVNLFLKQSEVIENIEKLGVKIEMKKELKSPEVDIKSGKTTL